MGAVLIIWLKSWNLQTLHKKRFQKVSNRKLKNFQMEFLHVELTLLGFHCWVRCVKEAMSLGKECIEVLKVWILKLIKLLGIEFLWIKFGTELTFSLNDAKTNQKHFWPYRTNGYYSKQKTSSMTPKMILRHSNLGIYASNSINLF